MKRILDKIAICHTTDTYPLSPMQQGMLFHYVSEQNSGVDIEQIIFSLPEDLNIQAFRSAWEQVVSRHAVLRTSFRWEKLAEPLQDVHQEVSFPYIEKDWSGLSNTDQAKELDHYFQTDRQLGFDLSKAPNLRLMVARLAEGMYKCVWTFHHILLDGRSFPIVLNEVFAIYNALCRGVEVELPQPRPFKDYIDWLQQQDWSKSEAFWRDKLTGFKVPNNLQTIRLRKASDVPAPAKGDQELKVPEHLTSALKAFAAETGVTLNHLVLGAWSMLLSRNTGEEDIVFGTTRACRRSTVSGADSIVGILINTVPFRISIPPDQSLAAWLKGIRDQIFAVRQHESTPLINIQKWSEIQGRKTLFDSLVMFDHAQLDTSMILSGEAGPFRDFELKEDVGFPLVLQVYGEDRLLLKIQYSTVAYDDATVTRMLGHLQTLLAGMLTGADMPIGNLPMLTAPEKQQLLFDWNDNSKEYPSNLSVQQIFEQQAARKPEAVALTCSGQSLTYRQLNARSNRLARELRTLGVGPDVLVGICMERSNDLVIGLLAIIKAGGAYLPIDLAYPADRLAFMLADANAPVLLTQSKLTKDLPATAAKVLCVDDLLEQPEAPGDDENPPATAGPDHLAYVIYTSGTTGKPKGSCITHRNVTRLFSATEHWYHFNHQDVWSLFHSYAFDFSVWEIWGALLYGGRLVVVPYLVSRSPEAFYELLAEEHVTVLNQTPSAFRMLIHAEETAAAPRELSLRYVIFGGEALEMQSLRPWFDRHGDQQPQLVNMYGITETTVHVTYRPLSKDDLNFGSVIGVPIPDLQVYILDSQRQPVPIGVPGEMYVGGAGLARGYLGRPELTAERFIPDHINGRPGSRLYRTGDLARFLPGRDIEYLGRIDHQVKIRGFRIELGEIESVLCTHKAVRESIVIARQDDPGENRLVAYITAKTGAAPNVKELREHLKVKMPEYMVPAAFVLLDKLPLTDNGKVDRKALPAPDLNRLDAGAGGRSLLPRNEMEHTIGAIWQEVLHLEKVGIEDSFFDLGGHSLLLIQIQNKLETVLNRQVSIMDLFRYPTISSLAEYLSQKEKAKALPVESQELMQRVQEGKKRQKERLKLRRH